jgi:hypothetical protein
MAAAGLIALLIWRRSYKRTLFQVFPLLERKTW